MHTRKKTKIYSNQEKLTIVTVSARPKNIPLLSKSIENQKNSWKGELEWEIIFDINDKSLVDKAIIKHLDKRSSWIKYSFLYNPINKSSGGNHGKDVLIKKIKEGWIYQLDDDNDLYPMFLEKISTIIGNKKNCSLICFWQHGRYRPNNLDEMKTGTCDTAMYFFHKDACRGIDYPLYYGGDGDFFVSMKNKSGNSAHLEKEDLCWYNILKSNQKELDKLNFKNKMVNNKSAKGELAKLAIKYECDKHSRHNYCEVYEEIFEKYRHKEVSILEIGVLKGASMRMWKEWFSKAEIIGVDITSPIANINGVKIIQADSQNIEICNKLHYKKFDIIIDDGDHHPYSQLKTLWNCWPMLKNGGIYVIEDIQNLNEWGSHWDFIGGDVSIFDQRKNKGTYDSVIIKIKKYKNIK